MSVLSDEARLYQQYIEAYPQVFASEAQFSRVVFMLGCCSGEVEVKHYDQFVGRYFTEYVEYVLGQVGEVQPIERYERWFKAREDLGFEEGIVVGGSLPVQAVAEEPTPAAMSEETAGVYCWVSLE